MKASELRIGNYILLPSKNKKVYEVASGHDIDEIDGSGDAVPIPLTEEWLIKFGLSNCGYENLFWVKDSGTNRFEISAYDGSFGIRINDLIDVNLEYVHQLQNLYFALTGEELTIK